MSGDYTRRTFERTKAYRSVLRQQGRVQVDADTNEAEEIDLHLDRIERRDVIGPSGVPNSRPESFKIELSDDGSAVQIVNLDETQRIYVDGLLCELFEDAREQMPALDDRTTIERDALTGEDGGGPTNHLVYLKAWEREVSAVEDPDLVDPGLGLPDTAARTKIAWTLETREVDVADPALLKGCDQAPRSRREEQLPELAARTEPQKAEKSECEIPVDAGYRGVENQLYRVEVHSVDEKGERCSIKWSRENGSVTFPLKGINEQPEGTYKVILGHLGQDEHRTLDQDDIVELVDQNRAEAGIQSGLLARVTDIPDPQENIVELEVYTGSSSLSAEDVRVESTYIKRWDHPSTHVDLKDGAIEMTDSDPLHLENGIVVEMRFSDHQTKPGDYWLIPARSDMDRRGTGEILWPPETSSSPDTNGDPGYLPAKGMDYHYAPLAVVRSESEDRIDEVHDCRTLFPPLTEITSDPCCTVTVGPEEDVRDLHDAVELIVHKYGGSGCICLLPGVHEITEPISVERLRGVTIEGCEGRTILLDRREGPAAQRPLMRFKDCRNVTVRGMNVISSVPRDLISFHASEQPRDRQERINELERALEQLNVVRKKKREELNQLDDQPQRREQLERELEGIGRKIKSIQQELEQLQQQMDESESNRDHPTSTDLTLEDLEVWHLPVPARNVEALKEKKEQLEERLAAVMENESSNAPTRELQDLKAQKEQLQDRREQLAARREEHLDAGETEVARELKEKMDQLDQQLSELGEQIQELEQQLAETEDSDENETARTLQRKLDRLKKKIQEAESSSSRVPVFASFEGPMKRISVARCHVLSRGGIRCAGETGDSSAEARYIELNDLTLFVEKYGVFGDRTAGLRMEDLTVTGFPVDPDVNRPLEPADARAFTGGLQRFLEEQTPSLYDGRLEAVDVLPVGQKKNRSTMAGVEADLHSIGRDELHGPVAVALERNRDTEMRRMRFLGTTGVASEIQSGLTLRDWAGILDHGVIASRSRDLSVSGGVVRAGTAAAGLFNGSINFTFRNNAFRGGAEGIRLSSTRSENLVTLLLESDTGRKPTLNALINPSRWVDSELEESVDPQAREVGPSRFQHGTISNNLLKNRSVGILVDGRAQLDNLQITENTISEHSTFGIGVFESRALGANQRTSGQPVLNVTGNRIKTRGTGVCLISENRELPGDSVIRNNQIVGTGPGFEQKGNQLWNYVREHFDVKWETPSTADQFYENIHALSEDEQRSLLQFVRDQLAVETGERMESPFGDTVASGSFVYPVHYLASRSIDEASSDENTEVDGSMITGNVLAGFLLQIVSRIGIGLDVLRKSEVRNNEIEVQSTNGPDLKPVGLQLRTIREMEVAENEITVPDGSGLLEEGGGYNQVQMVNNDVHTELAGLSLSDNGRTELRGNRFAGSHGPLVAFDEQSHLTMEDNRLEIHNLTSGRPELLTLSAGDEVVMLDNEIRLGRVNVEVPEGSAPQGRIDEVNRRIQAKKSELSKANQAITQAERQMRRLNDRSWTTNVQNWSTIAKQWVGELKKAKEQIKDLEKWFQNQGDNNDETTSQLNRLNKLNGEINNLIRIFSTVLNHRSNLRNGETSEEETDGGGGGRMGGNRSPSGGGLGGRVPRVRSGARMVNEILSGDLPTEGVTGLENIPEEGPLHRMITALNAGDTQGMLEILNQQGQKAKGRTVQVQEINLERHQEKKNRINGQIENLNKRLERLRNHSGYTPSVLLLEQIEALQFGNNQVREDQEAPGHVVRIRQLRTGNIFENRFSGSGPRELEFLQFREVLNQLSLENNTVNGSVEIRTSGQDTSDETTIPGPNGIQVLDNRLENLVIQLASTSIQIDSNRLSGYISVFRSDENNDSDHETPYAAVNGNVAEQRIEVVETIRGACTGNVADRIQAPNLTRSGNREM